MSRLALVVAVIFAAEPAFAAEKDSYTQVVLALAVILAGAELAGHLATRVGQRSVLGELAVGVLFGSLGIAWFEAIEAGALGGGWVPQEIDAPLALRGRAPCS